MASSSSDYTLPHLFAALNSPEDSAINERRRIQEQLASLESAMADELSQRGRLEASIERLCDAKTRTAMDRIGDAIEAEMFRVTRRLENFVDERLDKLSRVVVETQRLCSQHEKQLIASAERSRQLAAFESRLERRLAGYDEKLFELENEKLRAAADEIFERKKESLVADMKEREERSIAALQRRVNDIDERAHRLEISMTTSTLKQEITELREALLREIATRDESDRDVVDVLTHYARLMHRQFG